MRRFRNHEFDVLVASRVASEGLDFEFCSAIVNYDLPWNPMEVEQRIGRIDRFGQEETRVRVVNFHSPGTIETEIIFRVMDRIGVFNDSIGELDPILQPLLPDLKRTMFNFDLTAEERTRKLDEVAAAVANGRRTIAEMETAASYLASTDTAEIVGLERGLQETGRYVGANELMVLLDDWTGHEPGSSLKLRQGGLVAEFKGTASMERQLAEVRAAGERSQAEIEDLARKLRNEQPIYFALDQDEARRADLPLLGATHPLVHAAARLGARNDAKFAAARIEVAAEQRGGSRAARWQQ
jgi:superfamily II DNA/RNA helicase